MMRVSKPWVVAGVLLGVLLTVSPGSAVIGALMLAGIVCVHRSAEAEDRRFLIRMLLAGLGLRIVAAFVAHTAAIATGHAAGRAAFLPGIGDDVGYSGMAWALVKFWHGSREDFANANAVAMGTYFLGFHTYVHALVYELFGWVPLVPKYLNCLLGSLTAVFGFWLGKDLFGRTVGRWVCAALMFIPSLVYWSISNLKDPMIIFSLLLAAWAVIRWRRTVRLRYVGFLAISLGLMVLYREALLNPVLAALALGLPWLMPWPRVGRWLIIAGVVLAGAGLAMPSVREHAGQAVQHQLWSAMNYQVGSYFYRGQTYRIYENRIYDYYMKYEDPPPTTFTPRQVFSAATKAWVYFFLTPFPWQANTAFHFIVLPQVLACYALFPLAVLGAAALWRARDNGGVVILTLIAVIGSAMALGEANVGAAVRHRDLLLPFYLLLGVAGMAQCVRPDLIRSE